jgi:hypothetical protein
MGKFSDAVSRGQQAAEAARAQKLADEVAAIRHKLKPGNDWLETVVRPVVVAANEDLKDGGLIINWEPMSNAGQNASAILEFRKAGAVVGSIAFIVRSNDGMVILHRDGEEHMFGNIKQFRREDIERLIINVLEQIGVEGAARR